MISGNLNTIVEFQSLQRVDDGGGGYTEEWASKFLMRGQFSPERGRERIQAGRVADQMAGVLRVRSSEKTRQIDTTYRALMHGKEYNIRGVSNPDQRNDMLEFTVELYGS